MTKRVKKNIKENYFKSVKALKVIAILTAYLSHVYKNVFKRVAWQLNQYCFKKKSSLYSFLFLFFETMSDMINEIV
jgi:hypothetical protein